MRLKTRLLSFGVMAAVATAVLPGAAIAADAGVATTTLVHLDIPEGPAAAGLNALATQAGLQLFYPFEAVKGRSIAAVKGDFTRDQAIQQMAAAAGLRVARVDGQTVTLDAPQSGSAAGDGADAGTVAALVVTAQKKEENIQDVPIAISAFTQKSLEEQKIEGGFDLLKAIPNVTFSKNNFTGYNFSIRGIGTKAVSATTDPGVAVAFNNTTLIQNRLFEQEYFDVERVEVLRGPQGTLYGRNATAGVINVISAKPNMQEFSGSVKAELGNYHSRRLVGMLNLPLVEDKLGVRFAGSMTKRDGYDFNSVTQNHINGRDLWSGRITVGFKPTERLNANLIWEHFNEDDNRSRTGKQLCHHDDSPMAIGSVSLTDYAPAARAYFSTGCKPGSLYDAGAFGTPNGLSLPYILALSGTFFIGTSPVTGLISPIEAGVDPYGGLMQSRDLRTIASIRDPKYRARADVVEWNVEFDLTDTLKLTSQTAYDRDSVYSFQDFNRFNTVPIFADTSQVGVAPYFAAMAPNGEFCDPQIGCSDTIAGFDISKAKASQLSQEFRLQSSFSGPVNFSLGANYTRFAALVDYYVMFNAFTMVDMVLFKNSDDITTCYGGGFFGDNIPGPLDASDPRAGCPYIDPNPYSSIDGEGHNYFLSKNPYKLRSGGLFGELYWRPADDIKVTAGLRYNDDNKRFVPVPSQLLLARSFAAGGYASIGYPEHAPIKQHWGEWTGRVGIDWKPDLSFTDQTMAYAFYSRGYKGGGANPPTPGFATLDETVAMMKESGVPQFLIDIWKGIGLVPVLQPRPSGVSATFRPEFVSSYEIGTKNTLLGGALSVNSDVFFYDYRDYQVSQIRDRTAVNENFNAKVWGVEWESTFAPTRNLQFIANVGYLDTKIGDSMKSIDVMNRTQGHNDWVVVKPWIQYPSNCIAPVGVVQNAIAGPDGFKAPLICGPVGGVMGGLVGAPIIDPSTGQKYDPANYPDSNNGAGFYADLGGNELPNSPHWTVNLGGQYSHELSDSWKATVRADAYWQSQSWARVYNDNPYDKLHGWYNVNLSAWLQSDDGWKIELYAKNLLDKTPITDAFLNSDDTGLTTNVFVLDPRLIGLSVRKDF
ncbi:MAG: TonB-dependent receptor [Parcubacteria group bacterium]